MKLMNKKWATLRVNHEVDPTDLPVKKVSEVIKQLKKEGYTVDCIL